MSQEYSGLPTSKLDKTHWCFTITENINEISETTIDGVNTELCSHKVRIYIGPIEEADKTVCCPHRHGLLSISPANKRRNCRIYLARQLIAAYLGMTAQFDGYVGALVSTVNKYLNRIWKNADVSKTYVEQAVKKAINDIIDQDLEPTAKRVRVRLLIDEGATFVHKNKGIMDLMLQELDVYIPNKKVAFTVNDADNFRAAIRTLKVFQRILNNNMVHHRVETTHKHFKCLSDNEMSCAMMALTILPVLCYRWEGGDSLPGLYLWGEACTGKSHVFKASPHYAKIAQDAPGVSRFKLCGVQTGYLVDDAKPDFLDLPNNSATLRGLLLGDSTSIKILGDTQDVRGFMVFTSNEKPTFLGPEPEGYVGNWERNCNAWQRRFLSLQFTIPIDLDPIPVNWHHRSIERVCRGFYLLAVTYLPQNIAGLFAPYTEHINKYIDGEGKWKEEFSALMEVEEEWLNKHLPKVELKTINDVLKREIIKNPISEVTPMLIEEECPTECYCHKHALESAATRKEEHHPTNSQ